MSETWPGTDTCPKCAANLAYQSKGHFYSRCIGVEIPGVYDGVLFWQCPLCGHKWHRFPSSHRLTVIAERFVNPETGPDARALAARKATGCQFEVGLCECPAEPYQYSGCKAKKGAA